MTTLQQPEEKKPARELSIFKITDRLLALNEVADVGLDWEAEAKEYGDAYVQRIDELRLRQLHCKVQAKAEGEMKMHFEKRRKFFDGIEKGIAYVLKTVLRSQEVDVASGNKYKVTLRKHHEPSLIVKREPDVKLYTTKDLRPFIDVKYSWNNDKVKSFLKDNPESKLFENLCEIEFADQLDWSNIK